jgi:hypothetical protein
MVLFAVQRCVEATDGLEVPSKLLRHGLDGGHLTGRSPLPSFTREELHERVWREPLRTIAAELGVSDVWLRKACVKAQIPLPQQGHWAKLKAGKPTIQVKLGPRGPGMSEHVGFGRQQDEWAPRSLDYLLTEEIVEPTFSEPIEAVEARVRATLGKVKVSRSLDAPHHIIKKYLQKDAEREEKQRQSRYPSMFDAPVFNTPFEQRRLLILDTLICAATRMGAIVQVSDRDARNIVVTLNKQPVSLRVDTPKNMGSERQYGRFDTVPAGSPMQVRIGRYGGERWSWEDKKDGKVEAHLQEIAFRLIMAAEVFYREARVSNYKWKIEQRERLLEEQRVARERAEREARERTERLTQARIDKLLEEAADLDRAETIRRYVDRVRALVSGDQAATETWANRALAIADDLDPVRTGRYLHRAELQ